MPCYVMSAGEPPHSEGVGRIIEHWFHKDDSSHRLESYNLLINQESLKNSLDNIGGHLEKFFGNLINLYMQTVVYDDNTVVVTVLKLR